MDEYLNEINKYLLKNKKRFGPNVIKDAKGKIINKNINPLSSHDGAHTPIYLTLSGDGNMSGELIRLIIKLKMKKYGNDKKR